jgi:acyl-CoA synthetase (AMP-forming)/AMP-acid ligase II/pimeloyl-ACP methyl ester carboxylesterase
MVHGNPTWSFFFRKPVLALRDSHRCIVPDHIGMGLSDKPADDAYDYTLNRRIIDLERLLEELEIRERITLVLHDWGGMIGMGYACRHPERIDSLIIMNSAAFHQPRETALPWQLRLARGPLGPLLVMGFNLFCRGAIKQGVYSRPLGRDVVGAFLAPYASWSRRRAVWRFIKDIPLHPGDRSYALVSEIEQGLARFKSVPMLICWGLRDFVFTAAYLREWQRRFPQAEVHRYADAGHYLLEDAAEDITAAMKQFLGDRHVLSGSARVNIAARLRRYAKTQPDQPAVIVAAGKDRDERYTCRQLDSISDTLARGLRAAGLAKGARVVLMVPPGLDFFALAYALFKLGAVLVGVDPGMGVRNLGRCLAEAEPAAFIGNRKAHLARWLLRWAGNTIRVQISTEKIPLPRGLIHVSRILEWGAANSAPPVNDVRADDMAAILFTSGSTGPPKGAIYTHANFNAQVAALQNTFAIKPSEFDLATFPLFALFGPAMGMCSVIPRMDFTRPGHVNAARLIDTIQRYQATTMFGSPALLDRVGKWGAANNIRLPGLKRVLTAGAPVAPAVLERFSRLLAPGAAIHAPYGATEALPVSTIGSDEVLNHTRALTEQGNGICIGRAVAGTEIRIIPVSDDPIPAWRDDQALGPGQIGEIVVRGPQVTRSYYNREDATRLAKIRADDGTFYHRMGDLGYLDDQGRLWFCGRKSQRVITEQGVLYTIPCEAVFNTHPQVARTALVGAAVDGRTLPLLCVEPERGVRKSEYPRIIEELLELGGRYAHTAQIRHFLFHNGFPVDIRHNAKINRERLARWAQGKIR